MGNYQIWLILVQKPMRATPLKVHKFKKIQGAKNKKIIFFLKNVFFNAFIIVEDNQLLIKTFFSSSKKGTFSKKSFAQLS